MDFLNKELLLKRRSEKTFFDKEWKL